MNHHNDMPVALSDEELACVIGGQSSQSATAEMVARMTEQVKDDARTAAARSRTPMGLPWWRRLGDF
jgi:hypothetical protein